MMSELTRLHNEAIRILTTYDEHKNSEDEHMRRKAHLDLDYFLMEHRDTAIILFVEGLQREIDSLRKPAPQAKQPWWRRKKKGGITYASNQSEINQ